MRAFLLALFISFASFANAGVVTLDYSFTNFDPVAPTDPVVGIITYQAASLTSPIEQLLSISMTIAGHAYSLAEIGFQSGLIGGLVNDLFLVASGTNDFFLSFTEATSTAESFAYATKSSSEVFLSNTPTRFNVTFSNATSVPEPDSLLLMLLGLMCAVVVSTHKASRASLVRIKSRTCHF
jgi:hypothetical protein